MSLGAPIVSGIWDQTQSFVSVSLCFLNFTKNSILDKMLWNKWHERLDRCVKKSDAILWSNSKNLLWRGKSVYKFWVSKPTGVKYQILRRCMFIPYFYYIFELIFLHWQKSNKQNNDRKFI